MSKSIVNPARAGMIRSGRENAVAVWGKPRASGDDPVLQALVLNVAA